MLAVEEDESEKQLEGEKEVEEEEKKMCNIISCSSRGAAFSIR